MKSKLIFMLVVITMSRESFVEAIVVPEEEFCRLENPDNRKLISTEIEEAASELNGLSKTVICFATFVEFYMNQLPSRISVFLTEADNPDIFSVYLSKLQQVRSTYLLSGDIEATSEHNSALDALVILKSYQHLDNSTSRLIDLCRRNCRFGVAVINIFSNEETFMNVADDVVKLLWQNEKITNCVILGAVGDRLLAVQSQGFKANMLIEPSNPILVAKCSNDKWIKNNEIFPIVKMNDSLIHFSYIENKPYISTAEKNNVTVIAGGIEYMILKILRESLNFKMAGYLLEWGKETTIEEEIVEEFQNGLSIDLVVGGLSWMPSKNVDFALPYDVVQIVWLVPAHTNISFLGLISPFKPAIWILTLASILFGGVIKFFFFDDMSFLEITALVIGAAWYRQPVRLPYRIKFISWVIFGYVLTQVYLASLAGQLMAHADTQIDSLEELANSGLSFGGIASHWKLFDTFNQDQGEENSIIKRIYNEFIVFNYPEYIANVKDLMSGKNSSLALVVVLNMSSMHTNSHYRNCHKLKEVLASTPLAFPVRRGLQYLTQLDIQLEKLIQAGIISFLARNATILDNIRYQREVNDEIDNDLRLEDIAPIFLLLIMGYIVGFVCLLGEFIAYWWYSRKQTKKFMRPTKRIRLVEKNVKSSVYNNSLRRRVLKPNVTIGYYDDAGVPWKIL